MQRYVKLIFYATFLWKMKKKLCKSIKLKYIWKFIIKLLCLAFLIRIGTGCVSRVRNHCRLQIFFQGVQKWNTGVKKINPFVPNAPFLYLLKTSESLTLFWCFQGVEKGCSGNECVKKVFDKKTLILSFWF